MRHGFVSQSDIDSSAMESSSVDSPPWNRPAWIRPPWNRPAWIRPPWIHPQEKLHFAKEEKGIETVALVRVLNKERLDSLGADLQIEKEQGRVAGRRLRRKGKLD